MSRHFLIEADGGSRGNPGESGSGAVVMDRVTGEILVEISEYIGHATNNVAEYRALLAGVREALALDADCDLDVRMDSKLVIEQMSGAWKIKHPDMRVLAKRARAVFPPGQVTYTWVPREQNRLADALVNEMIDRALAGLAHGHHVLLLEGAAALALAHVHIRGAQAVVLQ